MVVEPSRFGDAVAVGAGMNEILKLCTTVAAVHQHAAFPRNAPNSPNTTDDPALASMTLFAPTTSRSLGLIFSQERAIPAAASRSWRCATHLPCQLFQAELAVPTYAARAVASMRVG